MNVKLKSFFMKREFYLRWLVYSYGQVWQWLKYPELLEL